MNKELAKILMNRLNGKLPFISKYGALVQVVEFKQETDNGGSVKKRIPVTVQSIIDGTCASYEVQMIPDSSEVGILYFEDGQTVTTGKRHGKFNFVTTITLVCWINKGMFKSNIYDEITMPAIAQILNEIGAETNPTNESFFVSLFIEPLRLPKQDANLFNKYTYEEKSMYLRPPYEYFGIEFKCSYSINPDCIPEIEPESTCENPSNNNV